VLQGKGNRLRRLRIANNETMIQDYSTVNCGEGNWLRRLRMANGNAKSANHGGK